jgi:glycosyltransferase involved in cell wall biosynthesis/uncharacterized membrane protein YbhN (UPF0104 family)
LRVLHLTSSFPRFEQDPVAPFLLDLARAQIEAGLEVEVLSPHDRGLPVEERLAGIAVRRFRYAPSRLEVLAYRGGILARARGPRVLLLPGFVAAFAGAAVTAAGRFRPDVLHAHWWMPAGLAGLFASRLIGVPLVITVHGTDLHLARSVGLRMLARAVLRRAAVVGAVSEALQAQVAGVLEASPEYIPVLRMPVTPQGPPSPFPPHPPVRVVAAGRLVPEKGFEVLIEAARILAAEGLDLTVEIVGDGPGARRLEALAQEADGRVRLTSSIAPSELGSHIERAHALVAPSLREGMGLVALEALSYGRPVIASRTGGLPEAVADGEDGLLVPPGDAQALARAIRQLPLPPPRGASLKKHLPEEVAKGHARVYQEASQIPAPRWTPWGWLGAALGIAILIALAVGVARDWPVIREAWKGSSPPLLTLAVAVYLVAEIGFGIGASMVLRAMRTRVGLFRAAAAFWVAQTAKNLPGAVWPAVARAGVASRWGVRPRRALAWLLIESLTASGAGLAVGAAALASSATLTAKGAVPRWLWVTVAIIAGLAPFVVLHPISPLRALTRRVVGDLPGPLELLPSFAAYSWVWAAQGLAFAILARALLPLDTFSLFSVGGAAAVAWVVGFLAIPVPAGLGVREAVAIFLLSPVLPASITLSMAIGARLISSLIQTGLAAAGLLILRRQS